jgi:hypothetical protein
LENSSALTELTGLMLIASRLRMRVPVVTTV